MPLFALFDPCTYGVITVLCVAGILHKKLARNILAFAAMHNAFILTTYGNGTLAVERVPARFYATAAPARFFVLTFCAVKSAS